MLQASSPRRLARWILLFALVAGLAAAARAQTVPVLGDIVTTTTWTADNVYDLQAEVVVLPGASLTIEAGTVVATSSATASLTVANGARIFVQGTETQPVIMTSATDRATWTGGDPSTGTYHVGAGEWGGLSILGDAYISENAPPFGSNTSTCGASNVAQLEGIAYDPMDPTRTLYGGGDDEDDSGSIEYLSIRYAGRIIALGNELNGLTLAGVGRGTQIHHVEVINSLDDGIEIFGGTCDLRYFSVWNAGDDSLDIDQGWRGRAQFGFLVQGYSTNGPQGFGVGDNAIEIDGAEDSNAQPVTTASLANLTVIGQPIDGDHLTAWRDNARAQLRNCVFMNGGDDLVRFDDTDGDGAQGYGFGGTLSWANTWATDFDSAPATGNDCAASAYRAQTSGRLAEISDCAIFSVADTTEAVNVGVFDPQFRNVLSATSPIQSITRSGPVSISGRLMVPVTSIDPRPAGDAVSAVNDIAEDEFFCRTDYRGAFEPARATWLCGWTSLDAYGFLESASCMGEPTTLCCKVAVTENIATSTTWRSGKTYDLREQIFVLPGATLTIEAGALIATSGGPGMGGALAVTEGAQIFIDGTAEDPVIMTSTADVETWTDGDPRTGIWRPTSAEWGGLAVMGSAYIGMDTAIGGLGSNAPSCSPFNRAEMEALIADPMHPDRTRYGGGDDDDDSGRIAYLSIRYAGRVVGLANEVNALSLGGVGRGTDIHHVDIMNGVDDGIEVFGGTVDLKYFNIWNVGDDSLDVDAGYRGRCQFGLIVQGYARDGAQGGGLGDNAIEMDGANDSDWQPVTTAAMYNLTVIGQPESGDGLTTWRDNARVQLRNCIFMDGGEALIRHDISGDGDGGSGYGHMGTLSFEATWSTAFDGAPATDNDCLPGDDIYEAQVDGNLAEIRNSVFFRNEGPSAYTNATALGVLDEAFDNEILGDMPIRSLARGPLEFLPAAGRFVEPVELLDPRPVGGALRSTGMAPDDGFFTPAPYHGAFSPLPGRNWICGWTAADAYGFLAPESCNETNGFCFGIQCPCDNDDPNGGCLNSSGRGGFLASPPDASVSSGTLDLSVSGLPPNNLALVVATSSGLGAPAQVGDGRLCISGNSYRLMPTMVSGSGTLDVFDVASAVPPGFLVPGEFRYFQAWSRDVFCTPLPIPCPSPCGNFSNVTNAVEVLFLP